MEVTLGEYEILGELGHGGMGSVFLARDPSLERHVAIKVLAPHLLTDDEMLARFKTEARIVAMLRHPGIVSIHKFRHVDDLHFFVMDYIEGVPLRSVLKTHGPLPAEVVKAVLYDVGTAISYAHGKAGGVIHRDLKPGNIMLEASGSAVVTDFGISRAVGSQSGLTVVGAVIGTPEYMSPEQCRGGEITAASDQYALGVVGYAMLVGAPPFSGQHYHVLAAHTGKEPPPLRELRPDCPSDLSDTIHRMLAKSPANRWPDIRDALRAFGGRPSEEGDPLRHEVAKLVREVGGVITPMMPVANIGVSGLPHRFEPGDTVTLEITPVDGLGRALKGRAVAIVSREPSVAKVGIDGSVIALAEGSARLVIQTRVTPSGSTFYGNCVQFTTKSLPSTIAFAAAHGVNASAFFNERPAFLSGISVNGSNRLLVCAVSAGNFKSPPVSVSSAVFDNGSGSGGQGMTQLGGYYYSSPSGGLRWSIWYLVAPTVGAGRRVVVNLQGSQEVNWMVSCVSYTGVHQTSPFGSAVTFAGGRADMTAEFEGGFPWMHAAVKTAGFFSAQGGQLRQKADNADAYTYLMDGNTQLGVGTPYTFRWSSSPDSHAMGAWIRPAAP